MLNKLYHHFFDLGIYPEKDDFHLGPKDSTLFLKRTVWQVLIYSLMVFGIVCREWTKFNPLQLEIAFSLGTFLAALFAGSPFFPSLIRRMTRLKPTGGLEYILVPFGYGYSINSAIYFIAGKAGI